MPQGAYEEDTRAGGHDDRQRPVFGGRATLPPAVAPRYDHGGAIVGGEVVDRPYSRRRERFPWPRNRVEAVVMVRQLCRLSRLNVDGLQRRKQIIGHQQPIEHRQHPGIVDEPVAYAGPAQHAVDALGAPALEGVASGVPQPGAHNLTDLPAFLGAEQVLPNDVAIAVQGRQIGLDDRGFDRAAAGRCPPMTIRQITPEILERCHGLIIGAHWYWSLSRWPTP